MWHLNRKIARVRGRRREAVSRYTVVGPCCPLAPIGGKFLTLARKGLGLFRVWVELKSVWTVVAQYCRSPVGSYLFLLSRLLYHVTRESVAIT